MDGLERLKGGGYLQRVHLGVWIAMGHLQRDFYYQKSINKKLHPKKKRLIFNSAILLPYYIVSSFYVR